MFDKFRPTKKELIIAGGGAAYMLLFFFLGVTKARFLDFVGIALLAGFYALIVWFVERIRA